MKHLCILIYLFLELYTIHGFICPDGKGECFPGMTCCELPNGTEGCCPFSDATCCNDKIHCCPKGLRCTNTGCSPVEEVSSIPLTKIGKSKNEICPDNEQCPDGQTCCPISSSSYGCCPMSNAVCCQDKKHCCPPGTLCDDGGYCYNAELPLNYSSSNVCPGGRYICPSRNTCCAVGEKWGCCPFVNAVCCPDQVHCCPEDSICIDGGCERTKKQPAFQIFKNVKKADLASFYGIHD